MNLLNKYIFTYDKHDCKILVLFRRGLNDFNSQSDFTNLIEHKYLKTHFIKIVPTDYFACVAHQETKHLIQIESK